MSLIQVEILGIDELRKQIQDMAQAVSPETVEPLLKEAAVMVRDEARRLAPVGPTRNLKKSIKTKFLRRRSSTSPRSALAGVDRKIAPHAHLVEFGSPGRYKKKDKAKARFHYAVGHYFGPMPAHPFMRPAWDTMKGPAYAHIRKGLKQAIEAKL